MDFSKQYIAVEQSVIRILCGNIGPDGIVFSSIGSGVLFGMGQHALTCFHCVNAGPDIVGTHSGKS